MHYLVPSQANEMNQVKWIHAWYLSVIMSSKSQWKCSDSILFAVAVEYIRVLVKSKLLKSFKQKFWQVYFCEKFNSLNKIISFTIQNKRDKGVSFSPSCCCWIPSITAEPASYSVKDRADWIDIPCDDDGMICLLNININKSLDRKQWGEKSEPIMSTTKVITIRGELLWNI